MIDISVFVEEGIIEVTVHGKLEAVDLESIIPKADEIIEQEGKVKGLLLQIEEFSGWDHVHTFLEHIKIIKAHHRLIERVAAVSDKSWQKLMPNLVSLFVKADVKTFNCSQLETARQWLRGGYV